MRKPVVFAGRHLSKAVLLMSAASLALIATAYAQSEDGASSRAAAGQLQDVTVTAQRRKENLQKVSANVIAIQGDDIAKRGKTSIEEILSDVPSVNVTAQSFGVSVNIRGMGADLQATMGQGDVAMEYDGVYSVLGEATVVGYFDLDRLEVQPGPQSTHNGPDADGGVVNVITKDPVIGKYSGDAQLTIGNYHLVRAEAAENIPINDVLAIRLSGAAINRDSYYEPRQGDAVSQSGRIKLLYKPSNDLSMKLTYQLDHIGGLGTGGLVGDYAGDSINKTSNPWGQGYYVTSGAGPSNNHESLYQNSLVFNGNYNLQDIAQANLITSYDHVRETSQGCRDQQQPPWSAYGSDGICTVSDPYAPMYQWTSEFRLSNAAGSRVIWDAGFYHWNYGVTNFGYSPYSAINGPAGRTATKASTNAVYGEATYPITPQLRLIGGLRESFDYKATNFGSQTNADGVAYETAMASANFSHFDYKAGIEYDAGPNSMEYFTASTGYRPGGVTLDGATDSVKTYADQEVTSFELGSKNRFLGNTLQVNGDVFYYIQNHYQDVDSYEPPGCGNTSTESYCSVPTLTYRAHEVGLELQTRYNVTPFDQFAASGSWIDARFDKNQSGSVCATAGAPSSGGCYMGFNDPVTEALVFNNIEGQVEPHSPKFSGNFSYNHTFDLNSGATVVAGASAFFTTSYYVHPVETTYSYQPSYWTQALELTYTAPNGKWSVNGYVHNLSNYAVKESVLPDTQLGDPRTFGVVLRTQW